MLKKGWFDCAQTASINNLENEKVLVGRRQITIGCVITSIVTVATAAAVVPVVAGDRITIAAGGAAPGSRCRTYCSSGSSHGDDRRLPRLRTHLVMMQLLLLLVVLIILVLIVIIVSGIDNHSAGLDSGVGPSIHHDLFFLLHDDTLARFLLDLHVHATIDDAIVIDSLNYFVHVAPIVDVIVIVLSQTIRLVRSTFLYRVDGVSDAEKLGVGAKRGLVRRNNTCLNRLAGAD